MKIAPQVSQTSQATAVKQESNFPSTSSQMHHSQNMTLQQQLSSQNYCEPTNYHMSSIKSTDSTLATNLQTTDNGPSNN